MVSILTSIFGFSNLDAAEDIVQETLYEACTRWGYGGIPERPEAWLMQVAKNKALNYLKRERIKRRAYDAVAEETPQYAELEQLFIDEEIDDSMLRMIFACAHPAITRENQIALVLKSLCGFSPKEIARALLVGEEAVAKRIYRAKREIVAEKIRLVAPAGAELETRLDVVCACLYLIFNEGYNSTSADELIRKDLCLEAMRLCKLLTQKFGSSGKVNALMALMCFHAARFSSRLDDKGAIIIFEEQDRSSWDRALINAGVYYLSEAAVGDQLSDYHLEASIAAQHCLAPSFAATRWKDIYALYEQLYAIKPTPVIALNLAVISGKIHGPASAIERLLALRRNKQLAGYHLLYATLGQFYLELRRLPEAHSNFSHALGLTDSMKERALLQSRLDAINANC